MLHCDAARIGPVVLLALLLGGGPSRAAESGQAWQPIATAFHVHSSFSSGSDSLDTLAEQAKADGIGAVFLTDNLLLRFEYGLFPLRDVLRRTVTMPSVLEAGVGRFLSSVGEANLRHPGVMLIPGVEAIPLYYWTGSVFGKDLTMHDAQKNMLVLGLRSEEAYAHLPVAGNRGAYEYGWWTVVGLSPVLLIVPGIWLSTRKVDRKVKVGWTFMVVRERRMVPGIVLLSLAGLLLVNNYPFGVPTYDTYDGEQGLRPHQHLIDYVRERDGLTVWSMPEARDFHQFNYGQLGTVTVRTDPYPEALLATSGYTGFGAAYQDTITVTDPGGIWDRALLEYARGARDRPPWGFGEIAYHTAGSAGIYLHQVQTVLWVGEQTPAALLEAMRKGRMYALVRTKEYGLKLDDFSLASQGNGEEAISGETLHAGPATAIRVRLSVAATDGRPRPVPVLVIRSGRAVASLNETTPFRVEYPDTAPAAGEMAYYRLLIGSPGNRIVSNPIFVRGQATSPVTP
ncbi:MAG: hypothetical protein EPO02_02645 [Nitrospirae bacterium]|nr:MAG: hypothetical protein EPO02_02645 [Nitrospirota bacterium]